jgi:hypothetical protein
MDLQRYFIALRGIDMKTKKPQQVPITPMVPKPFAIALRGGG